MNVIAKISWYLERSVVTLKLRDEYLNTVTHNTPVLRRIKYWTDWYIDRYSMSTYTGVTNFQKTVKLVVILAQCRYTEIAQRLFKIRDIQYTSLMPDKILINILFLLLFSNLRTA